MSNIFNIINFSNYLAFSGLIIIPLVVLIIKLYPPTPNKFNFSSLFLFERIDHVTVKKFKTPLWLLLYRLIFVSLIILFFSRPYLNLQKDYAENKYDNYIIIFNMGWSTAKEWPKIKNLILKISEEAESKGKDLMFYHTGLENFDNVKIFKSTNRLEPYLESLSPRPWQFEGLNLSSLSEKDYVIERSKVFLLSSKFDFSNYSNYLDKFNQVQKKAVSTVIIDPVDSLLFISDLSVNKNNINLKVYRLGFHDFKQEFSIKIFTNNNEVIYTRVYEINENQYDININQEFPLELINQIKRIEISGQNHAAAKYYFDDYSKKRNIAIISEDKSHEKSPLLSPVYYLKKSLGPDHIIEVGKLDNLIQKPFSVIILPENVNIPKHLVNKLENWLQNGGTIIRFSGDNLTKNKSLFSPAYNTFSSIRFHKGKLKIQNKLLVAPFEKNSIFYGLTVPKDINIYKQLVFSSNTNNIKYLAKLTDNTPLVSMRQQGDGKIILFHIGANNDWSDLPLSSLFPNMLEKLLLFARNQSSYSLNEINLIRQINGFGNLVLPKKLTSLENTQDIKINSPSKVLVPGIYENSDVSVAINLATKIKSSDLQNFKINKSKILTDFKVETKDLSSLILKVIIIMFIFDIFITILIKNNIKISNYVPNKKKYI